MPKATQNTEGGQNSTLYALLANMVYHFMIAIGLKSDPTRQVSTAEIERVNAQFNGVCAEDIEAGTETDKKSGKEKSPSPTAEARWVEDGEINNEITIAVPCEEQKGPQGPIADAHEIPTATFIKNDGSDHHLPEAPGNATAVASSNVDDNQEGDSNGPHC